MAQPSSGTCTCPDCGDTLRKLGDDSAEQLDVAPVQRRVVRTIRPKYSCRLCEKIVQAGDGLGQHGGMSETVARLHIALADTDPLVWRRVDVPVEASLKMLHDVIQGAFAWLDYHLWEFEAGDKRYGVPDPDWDDDSLLAAKNTRLKTLLERGIRQFLYTYDMGDTWEHIVIVEDVRDGEANTKYPRYVEGERRAPPEDCGGTPGFEAFLEAIANPKHPEHKHLTEWHQGCYGEPFDPKAVDERQAEFRIAASAKRRAAGKASQTKKSR